MVDLVILADDLSGAAESAATALLRTTRIQVHLVDGDRPTVVGPAGDDARVVAADLDTRRATPAAVAAAVVQATALIGPSSLLLVKIDSILRGRPDRLLAAVRDTLASTDRRALTVVCPATPSIGRSVVGGVVHVDGTPLTRTDLWRAEREPTPTSVADAVDAPDAPIVPLDVVRGPRATLVDALDGASVAGVVVCDAQDDDDLDAIVAAVMQVPRVRPVLVGAGAMAAAAARSLSPDATVDAGTVAVDLSRILVVVGSVASTVADEVEALRRSGAEIVDLPVTQLLAGRAEAGPSGARVTVMRPEPSDVDPTISGELVSALASAVVSTANAADALVLTGGETARAVLSRLGIRHLRPLSVTGGAVTSRADDGRLVVTRPGSFGGACSLAEIVSSLTDRSSKELT